MNVASRRLLKNCVISLLYVLFENSSNWDPSIRNWSYLLGVVFWERLRLFSHDPYTGLSLRFWFYLLEVVFSFDRLPAWFVHAVQSWLGTFAFLLPVRMFVGSRVQFVSCAGCIGSLHGSCFSFVATGASLRWARVSYVKLVDMRGRLFMLFPRASFVFAWKSLTSFLPLNIFLH